MDPLTAMAMGSTAMTAIGKIIGGFSQSSLDKLQQGIANSNTTMLRNKAALEAQEGGLALAEGGLGESRVANTVNKTLGAETGKFSASNLDPTYGSPLLLEGFTAGQGATDMALIGAKAEMGNANALLQSAGTLQQAAGSQGQASAFGFKSTSDILAGILGAGAVTLTAASNPNLQWGNLNSAADSIGAGKGGMDISGITVGG